MRRITIEIDGPRIRFRLHRGQQADVCADYALKEPITWPELMRIATDVLQLEILPPPGLRTEGDQTAEKLRSPEGNLRASIEAWQAALCGFGMPGFGWGFWLPCLTETCCGFRDEAAAAKAAKFLRHNLDVITGDLPNGVFEIFGLTGTWAFLDLHGDVHASFPTREEARGCASKLEALQMQNVKPQT